MNKYIFLNSLKAAMKANGHTQKDVAEIAEIHQSHVSKILNGKFSREEVETINCLKKYSRFDEYLKQHQLTGAIDKAVADIWDGSPQMERRIANIIRRLGPELALLDHSDIEPKAPKAAVQSSRT